MARKGGKSPGISLPELRRAMGAGDIAPAYLLLGEESALRRRALESIRAPFDEDQGLPGTLVQLDAARASIAEIVDEARALPLFGLMAAGPSRLVRVVGLEALEKGDAQESRVGRADPHELVQYLADPVPATCLVLEATKLDRRRALFKALSSAAVIVNCEPPRDERDVVIWIEATLRNRGYRIESDAVAYLLQMAGKSITVLEQELEKAMLHAGEGGTVRAVDLEGLMGRSREHSVFELTDALVRRDREEALRVLNMLLDDGEAPIGVLAMIGWICRQLVVAGDLVASGCSRREAMEGIAGRWQQRGQILDRARRSGRESLMQTLVGCAEAELFIKRMRDARRGADRLRPARGRLEALCRQICAA